MKQVSVHSYQPLGVLYSSHIKGDKKGSVLESQLLWNGHHLQPSEGAHTVIYDLRTFLSLPHMQQTAGSYLPVWGWCFRMYVYLKGGPVVRKVTYQSSEFEMTTLFWNHYGYGFTLTRPSSEEFRLGVVQKSEPIHVHFTCRQYPICSSIGNLSIL